MTYNRIVKAQTAPREPYHEELLFFPAEMAPFMLGALDARAPAFIWAQGDEYIGEQLIRGLQLAILLGSGSELQESINRVYRLLDSALYGRIYTANGPLPEDITPPIPAVPAPELAAPGLVANVDALPGVLDAGWFGIGGHKATLADIVAALRVGNQQSATSIADKLQTILTSTSSAANIGQLISDLFFGTVETAEEGGIMVLLAGAIAGNVAATSAISVQLAQQLAQLQRLTNSIDGGGLPPEDSLLEALRGAIPAGADRNVIDSSADAMTIAKLDDMIAQLQAIREALA